MFPVVWTETKLFIRPQTPYAIIKP